MILLTYLLTYFIWTVQWTTVINLLLFAEARYWTKQVCYIVSAEYHRDVDGNDLTTD